jgi:hypothetical protein
MTISVETVTGKKDSTLVLPTEAVREPDGGKPWVLVAGRHGPAPRGARRPRRHRQGGDRRGPRRGRPGDPAASGALDGDKVRIRPPKPRVGGLQVPQGMTK